MKIPLNWLKEFVKLPDSTKDLTDNLTMVGHMLDKKIQAGGQTIIDLELRGNRADCYSIYGIAREVSAIYEGKLKPLSSLQLTTVSKPKSVDFKVDTPLVKRAGITEIYDVKITRSPKWLKERVENYGMDSVNNIVDLTNYVMIEMGEPLHAFDLDKVKGDTLEIRLAKEGEKITTFHDETITLTKDDLVWAKGETILSIAGAIGEKYNSISDTTKNVLLEAANYDRANIRKSIYRHNILTEAGIRHEKELDPNMVSEAIGRFLYFIKKYNWGRFDSTLYDYYPKKSVPWNLKLDLSRLSEVGGIDVDAKVARKILEDLGFGITKSNSNLLEVKVPTFRTDVTLPEDVIEEILRVYGYDKIPSKVLSLEIPNQITTDYIKQEEGVRLSASAVGFNEVISSTFVRESLLNYNLHPQIADAKVVSLINPPSPDTKYLRATLLPNLYELIKKAVYEREEHIALFELGKIYYKKAGGYKEDRKVAFVFYDKSKNAFVNFKRYLYSFFARMQLTKPTLKQEVLLIDITKDFEIYLDNKGVGFGGELDGFYYAEIDLNEILGKEKKYQVDLWPKYPPQIEDITFTLPAKTYVGEVTDQIQVVGKQISKVEFQNVYKDAYTFRVWYQDPKKTLDNKEVEKLRKDIVQKVKEKFGGVVKD